MPVEPSPIVSSSPIDQALILHQCGREVCRPRHGYGPAIRDHYLIHCVLDGCGQFFVRDKVYDLTAGQGFLILPGVVTTYVADDGHPWTYAWVGFNGTHAKPLLDLCGLCLDNPIFTFADCTQMDACLAALQANDLSLRSIVAIARLYDFFALLQQDNRPPRLTGSHAVDAAADYVSRNYSYGITVEDIARFVGVDRSQLFRIFKRVLGMSPQQYLQDFRFRHATELMSTTTLNVTEILYSCGFNDSCHFSRQFRKLYGMSPSAYMHEVRTGKGNR